MKLVGAEPRPHRHRSLQLPRVPPSHRAGDGARRTASAQRPHWHDPLLRDPPPARARAREGVRRVQLRAGGPDRRRPRGRDGMPKRRSRGTLDGDARRARTSSCRPALRAAAGTAAPTSWTRAKRRAPSAPGPTRSSTPSSRARRARARSCSSASTRSCSRRAQGARPEHFHVVTPDPVASTPDLSHRRLRRLLPLGPRPAGGDRRPGTTTLVAAAHYPEPVEHCDVCPWHVGVQRSGGTATTTCRSSPASRGSSATSSRRQGVATLTALAQLPVPLDLQAEARRRRDLRARPRAGAAPARVARPAAGRSTSCVRSKRARGLRRLPEPSPGDIFLDLEGDPFAREGGREYLFGLVTHRPRRARPCTARFWAFTDHEERAAFEAVMDLIAQSLDQRTRACTSTTTRPTSRRRSSG